MGGVMGSVGSTLAETFSNGGIIGQIIAAVLSILDVLKEGIGTLVSGILDSVLGAVNGILENILSGELFTQIGRLAFLRGEGHPGHGDLRPVLLARQCQGGERTGGAADRIEQVPDHRHREA